MTGLANLTANTIVSVLGFAALLLGFQLLLFCPLTIVYEIWKRRSLRRLSAAPFRGRVSVLVPAYNEEKTILACVESILASDYPDLEVIVVNDGSTDETEGAIRTLTESGRIKYLWQSNRGKATALNRGAAAATGEVILFTDADSVFLGETITRMTRWFADPTIHAVCGNDTPLSAGTFLQKILVVTTHIGTGFIRRALSVMGVLPIITGNLGAVRAETFSEIGGFLQVWGEDLEYTFRLHQHHKRIIFDPEPIVKAECPADLAALWRQRVRWVRSYLKITLMHRHLFSPLSARRFSIYLPVNYFTQILVPLLQLLAIPFFLRLASSGSSTFTSTWNLIFYFGLLTFLLIALYSILLARDTKALRHLPLVVLAIAPLSYFYNFVVVTSVWRELWSEPELWEKLERRPTGLTVRRGGFSLAFTGLLVIGLVGGVRFLARPALLRVELGRGVVRAAHSPAFNLAVATHFDAWQDWHKAVSSILENPKVPLIQTIGLSAGRPEWAYFRWKGHPAQWSAQQKKESADILGESVRAFNEHGFQTVTIVDVYATNLLRENPQIAAVRFDGARSPDQVCFTELADGAYGQQVIDMVAYLVQAYPVSAIALTELGYESSCFDDRCLMSYRRATGRKAWPARRAGTVVDPTDPSIWEWRSARMEGFLARVADVVHRAGKKFIVDVPVSWDDLNRYGKDSGLDYRRVLRHADQIVVWNYFGAGHRDPRASQLLARSLRKEFAANRLFVSIGLWGSNGTLAPEEFQEGLAYTLKGGVSNIWITPNEFLSPSHWDSIVAVFGRHGTPGRDPNLTGSAVPSPSAP